jgi:hypothetical protein
VRESPNVPRCVIFHPITQGAVLISERQGIRPDYRDKILYGVRKFLRGLLAFFSQLVRGRVWRAFVNHPSANNSFECRRPNRQPFPLDTFPRHSRSFRCVKFLSATFSYIVRAAIRENFKAGVVIITKIPLSALKCRLIPFTAAFGITTSNLPMYSFVLKLHSCLINTLECIGPVNIMLC